MSEQVNCPRCASLQVMSTATGEDALDPNANKPPSLGLALLVCLPVGLFCGYMLVRFGPGSGLGLWILGLVLAIATPYYIWKEKERLQNTRKGWTWSCRACGYQWQVFLEGI